MDPPKFVRKPVTPEHELVESWSYPTPLEPPENKSFLIDPRVIEINGMKFQKRTDCDYLHDYYNILDRIEFMMSLPKEHRVGKWQYTDWDIWSNLIEQDLWFFVYFVMKNPLANHPFIVNVCKEIQEEKEDTLEVWARDHLKTTIISVARACQKVFIDPEKRIGIFSATRPLAVKIQNVIKKLFEDKFLLRCFPHILYDDPYKDAEKWSESPEGGLIVKRKGFFKEPTISSWGLVEGMPTGYHFSDIIYDDIVTQDLQSPEIMRKVMDNFDMSENLSSRDCQRTVVGTFYRHDDPLVYIRDKKDPVTNIPMFKLRLKAATEDGTLNGKAVFSPEKTLAKKRAGNLYFFYCQQLLNPTPRGLEKLNPEHLIIVNKKELPQRLYKFMFLDGAGDAGKRVDRAADAWALGVVGVEPLRDEVGASRIYILDLMIEEMDLIEAQNQVVEMYCRNGKVLKLGVEKVGMSTTEIHIANALRAKKRFVSVDRGNLQILKPGGRSKEYRIESALSWPLKNGKIHVLDTVPKAYVERLKLEMEKFPLWHDDGLDGLSYVYDMVKDYRFSAADAEEKKEDAYDRAFRKSQEKFSGWIAV